MKIYLLAAVLTLCYLPLVNADGMAIEEYRSPEMDLNPVVSELLLWIQDNTHYTFSIKDGFPTIVFYERGETIQYESHSITLSEGIKGLYDSQVNSIILVDPWFQSDRYSVSTLLHELVHYMQGIRGTQAWDCPQQTEWEAYKLQEKWLTEHGLDGNFNWLQIQMLSQCEQRDIHPSIEFDR